MSARTVHLGFQVSEQWPWPVVIPIRHMAVTGQTQESGKTTTLEALISRSGMSAIAFLTKRGEGSFGGAHRILPFFKERADWQFVQSILESVMRQDQKFKQPWIMRACEGARSLADVQRRAAKLEAEAKHAMSQDMYMVLGAYLEKVVPLIASLPKTNAVDLRDGLSVMDLTDYPLELQMLVISSTLQWIYEHEQNVISIVPEAWEFVPQGKNTPVKLAAEKLVRKGAALRNYLWIDSQDMAAVDKMMLRACAVWLIGVQREANEIKRALSNMPAGLKKPKAEQVATLQLGQFYACFGSEIRKTYVQPAWMDEKAGKLIASGRLDVHDVWGRNFEHLGHTNNATQPVQAGTRPGEFPAGSPAIASDSSVRGASQSFAKQEDEEEMQINPQTLEALKMAIRDGAKNTALELLESISGNGPSGAAAHPSAGARAGDLAPARAKEGFCGEECTAPSEERIVQLVMAQIRRDPALIRLSQEAPAIEVKVNRTVVSMEDSTIKGKLALLIHGKFFEQPRSFNDVKKTLCQRGLSPDTPNVRISAALADFVQMGFFWRTEANEFSLAPGAQSRVVAA